MTDGIDLKVIGARLRAKRNELRLNQDDVAELAGVDVNTVRYVEAGSRNTSLGTLKKIAGVLGLEVEVEIVEIVTSEDSLTSTQVDTTSIGEI